MKRVVIVDDEAAHRLLIRRSLKAISDEIELTEADSLNQARALIADLRSRIELIILDVNLNGHSGFDLLKELRGSVATNSVPVIVLSTTDLEDECARAYALGANCFMNKSPDPAAFQAELAAAIKFLLRK